MKTECYCGALRLAARKTTAIYDEALAPAKINVAQFSLLRRIERLGPISFTALGRLSGLDRSTVGRNGKVLERGGLIEAAEGDDAREACVVLTPAGRLAFQAALPLWRQAQQKIEATIGPDAASHLRSLLEEL